MEKDKSNIIKTYDFDNDDVFFENINDDGETYTDVCHNVLVESEHIHDGIYTLWENVINPYITNIYVSDILINLKDFSKFYSFFIKNNELCSKLSNIINTDILLT